MLNVPADPTIERIAREFCTLDMKDPDKFVPFEAPALVAGQQGVMRGTRPQWGAYILEARRHIIASRIIEELGKQA